MTFYLLQRRKTFILIHLLSKATLLGLTVVQDRHTQTLRTAGHDCRIIIGLSSIYYKNILGNKTCVLGLKLSHGTSVTKS